MAAIEGKSVVSSSPATTGTGVEFKANNGHGTPTAQIDETPATTEDRSVKLP